jgi:acyl carrier protein
VVLRDVAEDAGNVEALRAHLKAALPEYMVPSALVMLERLPLTPNGKLDRRALPAPELEAYAKRAYEPPQGEIEEILAGIWQSLLHVERVGRRDNFFELGGHSILSMQVKARVQAAWSVELPIRSLFELSTIQELATQIEELRHQRLLARLTAGDAFMDDLLDQLAEMPESRVEELLRTYNMEERL